MSVWTATSYKLDIAKNVYEYLTPFHERILGETVSGYLQPKGDLVPICKTDKWGVVADVCNWDVKDVSRDTIVEIGALIKDVTNWSLGTSAVYQLIYAAHKGKFQVKPQYNYADIEHRARMIGLVVCSSTMITPESFNDVWTQQNPDVRAKSRVFEDFSEGWKYYLRSVRVNNDELAMIDQILYFGQGNRLFYGGQIGPLIILVGSEQYKNKGLILTKTHLNFLVEASARLACLHDHVSREYVKDKVLTHSILSMVEITIESSFRASKFNSDKVVQAFHKARSYMQMKLFQNTMANALDEALLEFQSKNLQTCIDLNKYVACFTPLPLAQWLEVFHVYKWMPPPDFDGTYAFTELMEHHMSTRRSGLDYSSSQRMKDLWALIVKERKLNIADAYRRAIGKWPDDLEVVNDLPTELGLDIWQPKGLFPYYTYGTDVEKQIKDKVTVNAYIKDEVKPMRSSMNRNFLTWYLVNRDRIDTRVDAVDLVNGSLSEDNYARVAYKGESHKPGSRLFFMAPPRHRILLGELEGNISTVAKHYPSSLQGVDALTRAARLDHLFDIRDPDITSGLPPGTVATSYVVTFDLSKFSPRFNPLVLRDLHDFWADVFDYDPIRGMSKIGADATILHTTSGLIMSYKNKGADLEGFRGRMMTLFHADLISAACRLASAEGYIVGKAVTAVFIDDGAVRVAVKGTGESAHKNALSFLECMQLVYAAAGQENHPNKTIVSYRGGELLAEQYLDGIRLRCPIKAGMRLYPNYENPASCISEEFDAIFSTTQGSVKDGATWVIAYRRLCDGYLKAIFRWNRKKFARMTKEEFAIKFVTPKCLGGFGFPSLPSLVSTAAYDMTSEGLGILNFAGRSHDQLAILVHKVIEKPLLVRDKLAVFRDPSALKSAGPTIVEGRLVEAILDRLAMFGGACSELVEMYRSEELREHARQVCISLTANVDISFPVMKRAWDSTPLAYIEGIVQKFKRSGTIQAILGHQGIQRVRRANLRDVGEMLDSFP